jgi:hypothetical protein
LPHIPPPPEPVELDDDEEEDDDEDDEEDAIASLPPEPPPEPPLPSAPPDPPAPPVPVTALAETDTVTASVSEPLVAHPLASEATATPSAAAVDTRVRRWVRERLMMELVLSHPLRVAGKRIPPCGTA